MTEETSIILTSGRITYVEPIEIDTETPATWYFIAYIYFNITSTNTDGNSMINDFVPYLYA